MKFLRRMVLGTAVMAGMIMMTPQLGRAYSYNAWVGMTGAKTVAVNPFYSVGIGKGTTYQGSFVGALDYGFSDKADIFIDFTDGWLMPRYDLSGDNLAIVGLMLGSAASGFGPGLQLHGIYDKAKMFAIEYNLDLSTAGWDFSGINMNAIVAPTLKLGNFGVWVEGDFNGLISGFGFDMGAGIYVNVGDDQISLGVNSILGSPNIGGWLWAPFSFK
jgi:hypothetical protein